MFASASHSPSPLRACGETVTVRPHFVCLTYLFSNQRHTSHDSNPKDTTDRGWIRSPVACMRRGCAAVVSFALANSQSLPLLDSLSNQHGSSSCRNHQNKIPPTPGGILFWWEWLDSNQLRLKPTDLQSAPALQLRRTPNLWCGQRESNPHFKLGRLAY